MSNKKHKGFTLLLVIMLIPLATAGLLIIGAGSNTMASDTTRAYLQAGERNLAASGKAWVQQAAVTKNAKLQKDRIELDIERLGLIEGNMEISVVEQDVEKVVVEIKTYCARGRKHVRQTHEYTVATAQMVEKDNLEGK
jgi:hypothetical protein